MDLTYPWPISGNSDGLRTSKLKHAVQGRNGDGDFGRATPICSRAQRIADHSFKPADGGLHQSPTRVPGSLLPADASMLRDVLEVPIALGRSGLCYVALHCRWSGWNDNFGSRVALSDSAIDAGLVIGSVANEGGEWAGDLVEQRLDLRTIFDIMGRQR
jgi:hypothetical protein